MNNWSFNPRVFRDPTSWQWAITVPLLAAHLIFDVLYTLEGAIVLCLVMAVAYFAVLRSVKPYPVQIRLGYVLLLLLGLLPWMSWIHWIQLVGTTARISVDYCLLARELDLLPWNRTEPLTVRYALRTILSAPTDGGLFVYSPAGAAAAAAAASACSMA